MPFSLRMKGLRRNDDEYADFVNVRAEVNICRDPKDNFLLALSIDGNANFLITGDKDLLDLKKFGETKIISIAEFLQDY